MSSILPEPPAQPEEDQPVSPTEATPEAEPIAQEAPTQPVMPEWEPNGGPLGCCLGIVVGLLLSLIIAVLSRFYGESLWGIFGGSLGILVRIVMGAFALGAAILCGVIGWRVGYKFYREYEPSPRYKRKVAELERRNQERYSKQKVKTRSAR